MLPSEHSYPTNDKGVKMDNREKYRKYNARARSQRYARSEKARATRRAYYYGLQERYHYCGGVREMLPGFKWHLVILQGL